MSYEISKEFSFCYGHRVFTQKVDGDYTENNSTQCKCRHIHGHEGLVRVKLTSDKLENSMVTDFLHLGWLKNFIDNNLDHKFVFSSEDPMFSLLAESIHHNQPPRTPGTYLVFNEVVVPNTAFVAGKVFNLTNTTLSGPEIEVIEGYFIVDFVPTSENFAKWLYDIVVAKMTPLGVTVKSVEWCETPKTSAIYGKD